ncbi:MAG TPA: glycosyltransferase [Solirubrobacterales bacterium]|nr:glycosyltransferase [Solirubrobacterales bacterium]
MRICLLCPEPTAWGDVRPAVAALAAALAGEHEVEVVRSGVEPVAEPPPLDFACPDHLHSALALEAIRAVYGSEGPDYLEVPDFRGHGLVPLQARLGGEPLLARTTIAVRVLAPTELTCLHDGTLDEPARRRTAGLEREQLRLADAVLWPGLDGLEVQRRYRPDLELPPATRLPLPVPAAAGHGGTGGPAGAPLRLLYLGPLQRHRGALDLAEACFALPADDWELTFAGADTETAAMGQSVRLTIEAMSGEDPRIRFEGELSAEELERRAGEFDLLAAPARFEVDSSRALTAMACGLPVLATPVGSLAEAVEPGVSGWQTSGIGAAALTEALALLLADRAEAARLRASGAPAERAARLADPERVRAGYRTFLADRSAVPDPAVGEEPLVTGVVPYFAAAEYVEEAVASLLDQTHRNLRVLIVNDGSFGGADAVVLERLAADPRVTVVTQPNRGESAARNLGARIAAGEFLVLLDADNVLEPAFVESALAAFRRRPDLAYVTCWLRKVADDGGELPEPAGYAALGNGVLREEEPENWDGDALAMVRRSILLDPALGYDPHGAMHNDWGLYRAFREAGLLGTVIPRRLARYRIAPRSISRSHAELTRRRGWQEVAQWNALRGVRWTAEAAR